jgi:hypothetical protein
MSNETMMKEIVEQYYIGNFQAVIDNSIEDVKWTSHKMANV